MSTKLEVNEYGEYRTEGRLWKLCRSTMRKEGKAEWMGSTTTCGRGVKEAREEASCFPSIAIASCPAFAPISLSSMCQVLGYPGHTEFHSFEWKDFIESESADVYFPKHFWGFFSLFMWNQKLRRILWTAHFYKTEESFGPWAVSGHNFFFFKYWSWSFCSEM